MAMKRDLVPGVGFSVDLVEIGRPAAKGPFHVVEPAAVVVTHVGPEVVRLMHRR